MWKGGYVYIMTNKNKTALYLCVTSDIVNRIKQHKEHQYRNSFTDRYNIEFLVYYEELDTIEIAIAREKEIKKWGRPKKEVLINSINPEWRDLYASVLKELL